MPVILGFFRPSHDILSRSLPAPEARGAADQKGRLLGSPTWGSYDLGPGTELDLVPGSWDETSIL